MRTITGAFALLLLAAPAFAGKPYTVTESWCIDNVQTCSQDADCPHAGDVCAGNRCTLGMKCSSATECPTPEVYGGCFSLDVTYQCKRTVCSIVNKQLR